MNKVWIFTLLTAFSVIWFSEEPIQSQDSTPKFPVYVDITCKDINTKATIQSYIKRELRSLGDVEIVVDKEKGLRVLHIVALEGEYEVSGRKTGGMAVAYMFLQKRGLSIFEMLVSDISDEKMKKSIRDFVELYERHGNYMEPQLGVMTDDTKDVEGLCKSIVINFDTKQLEPAREILQKFKR